MTDRALFHADNAYYYPAVRLDSKPLKTNTVSNTAFRGFGGPQGLIVAERIEEIAYALGKDPLEMRKANFYGERRAQRDAVSPDGEDNIIGRVVDELDASSDYAARRRAVLEWNAQARRDPEGDRADAGEVRDLVHRDLVQPGRRAWCMSIATGRSI